MVLVGAYWHKVLAAIEYRKVVSAVTVAKSCERSNLDYNDYRKQMPASGRGRARCLLGPSA